MAPILAKIGTVFVYTNGVFLALGFLWACFLLWKHIRISKFSEELSFDIVFVSFAGALAFGRILFGVLHFREFGFNLLHYILVNGYPGISLVGMIVGWFTTMFFMTRFNKIRYEEFLDYATPSVCVFWIITSLGSFFTGSEPGIKWGWFQHPVSVYRALIAGVGLWASIQMLFTIRKEKLDKGFTGIFFLVAYSFSQVALRPLKDVRALLTDSILEFWIFAILLLTSVIYIVYYFRVFLGGLVKTFINWNITYVKTTFKVFPHKAKKSDRGGAEENNSADRKS